MHYLTIDPRVAILTLVFAYALGAVMSMGLVRLMDRDHDRKRLADIAKRAAGGGWPVDANGFPHRRRNDDNIVRARSDDRFGAQAPVFVPRTCPHCDRVLAYCYAAYAAIPAWHCIGTNCPKGVVFGRWAGSAPPKAESVQETDA
jgi:hypothetical protein